MMSTATSLRNSIALHGALFFLAQGALLLGVTLGYGMPWGHFALFLGICAAYHGLLTGFLVARREDFHIEGTGVPLSRVNLSNTLTFGRLSSIPTIVFLIVQASYPILPVMLPLVCIVFATDWLDGIVARRRGEITFVGRYLDSSSDYLMIIAVSIMFYYFALIPLWFFILTICRLVLFAMGMALLALKEGKADPLSTFLGKASIFALMVLYVMEIARRFGVPWIGHEIVVQIMEYAVAIVVVISLVDKAIFLRRKFSKAAQRRAGTPPTAG